jgi:hypothetical protein
MPGLSDLAPIRDEVEVGNGKVVVQGIEGDGIIDLLFRFPELRKAVTGMRVDVNDLMKLGGEIIGAIIAAGTGSPGDKKEEEAARKLPFGTQVELITRILRATVPKGLGALTAQINQLVGEANVGGLSSRAQGSKSPSPSKN